MKKNDFNQFKISLNLNIEIDANLRRITEKIKLLSQLRNTTGLQQISGLLSSLDADIDHFFEYGVCESDSNSSNTLCNDESEE